MGLLKDSTKGGDRGHGTRMIQLESGHATDKGQHRKQNEDSVLTNSTLFAVADGLGGHAGGAVASVTATETLAQEVLAAIDARGESSRWSRFRRTSLLPIPTIDELLSAINRANQAVLTKAQTTSSLAGMGTTLCVLAIVSVDDNEVIAVTNVGDSRVYRYDESGFHQLTEDHTWPQEMLKLGAITPNEAKNHKDRNSLSRALGIEPSVVVDHWLLDPVIGHRYLLCSDGLTREVPDSKIYATLQQWGDPTEAAQALVDLALRHGGHDNVTAVVVDVVDVGNRGNSDQ